MQGVSAEISQDLCLLLNFDMRRYSCVKFGARGFRTYDRTYDRSRVGSIPGPVISLFPWTINLFLEIILNSECSQNLNS